MKIFHLPEGLFWIFPQLLFQHEAFQAFPEQPTFRVEFHRR